MFLGVSHASDRKGRDSSVPRILGPPYVRPVGLIQSNQIWYDNKLGKKRVFWGSAVPDPKGAGPQRPENFGTAYMRAHSMRNNKQILHGYQTRREESFCTVDQQYCRAICLLCLTFLLPWRDCGDCTNLLCRQLLQKLSTNTYKVFEWV